MCSPRREITRAKNGTLPRGGAAQFIGPGEHGVGGGEKCDGRPNEVGAPASGIVAEAVLTPWDKDLEPNL